MALTINDDSAIGFALIALDRSSNSRLKSMMRLLTGKRINKASDTPARIHRVVKINLGLEGVKTASRNLPLGSLKRMPQTQVYLKFHP